MRAAKVRKKSAPKDPVQKARDNPTWKNCVTGKCFDCQGGKNDPAIQWRIGNCNMPDCSLWPKRPYQQLYRTEVPKSLKNYPL